MKKEDIEKIHPNAEARMFNPEFKVVVEKRSEGEGDDMYETEYKMIEGVGAVMGVFTDMGWYREKINATAFAGCDMSNVVSLFNHDSNEILSRTTGKQDDLTLMIENNQLKYKYQIKNECAEKVAENIGLGFITGSSFMFRVKTDSWSSGADGVDEREILEIEKLYELGPVTFPAYQTTTVAARSRDMSKPTEEKKDKYYYKKQLRLK
jgi:HK97 family phage prohead protease